MLLLFLAGAAAAPPLRKDDTLGTPIVPYTHEKCLLNELVNPINHGLYKNLFTIGPQPEKTQEHVGWGWKVVWYLREV